MRNCICIILCTVCTPRGLYPEIPAAQIQLVVHSEGFLFLLVEKENLGNAETQGRMCNRYTFGTIDLVNCNLKSCKICTYVYEALSVINYKDARDSK